MAKRKRDYKAEYRRRKELARSAGFGSVRQYRQERKRLSLPRQGKLSPTHAIRQENQAWSDEHSRVPNSRWNPNFDDERARRYYRAFVEDHADDPSGKTESGREWKLAGLFDYVMFYDLITEIEWRQNYLGLE